jgi:predicted Holliday junction resolvase-like endonuclease
MNYYTIFLLVSIFISLAMGIYLGGKLTTKTYRAKLDRWVQEKEREIRLDAIKRSRATLEGRFGEQLAPYLPNFVYDPTEVRFIGSPIDFVVFPGLAKDSPREIVLIEVKSKGNRLSPREKKIKKLIREGKVRWELYNVPI